MEACTGRTTSSCRFSARSTARSARWFAVADGEAPGRAVPALEVLWARRRALRLLLLNRKVEAAKKVVDFRRWRDGNGALYLCAAPPSGPKRARP